jgi:hypothetical protein
MTCAPGTSSERSPGSVFNQYIVGNSHLPLVPLILHRDHAAIAGHEFADFAVDKPCNDASTDGTVRVDQKMFEKG